MRIHLRELQHPLPSLINSFYFISFNLPNELISVYSFSFNYNAINRNDIFTLNMRLLAAMVVLPYRAYTYFYLWANDLLGFYLNTFL